MNTATISNRKTSTHRLVKFSLWPLACLLLPLAGPAPAAVSQMPLTSSVESNVMFILDDSGSMQFEVMPDDYTMWGANNGYVIYLFPRETGVYGDSDYDYWYAGVATLDDNNAYTALMRSPQVNRIYYNPAVTYLPWANHDGTLFPNASITCAPHNPANTAKGCRDVTVNMNAADVGGNKIWASCNSAATCTQSSTTKNTFHTATYFTHNGGDIWTWNNYSKTEIKPATTTYSGEGRTKDTRTDCVTNVTKDANGKITSLNSCTYAEEIQNFANWYTYYRSRILTARAGIGRAFAEQGSSIRVGFGAINEGSSTIDGVSSKTLIKGVRTFTGTDKENFFTTLYGHKIPAQGTPLRKALDDAGQYYSRSDNRGPWGDTPGTDVNKNHLTCRQSYTILMTDGYWTYDGGDDSDYRAATSDARTDNDSTNGTAITGPNGSYTYTASAPFSDSRSNTLADVAMYYWKRDLRTIANEVPTNTKDPAFWQHMVTFGVGLGVTGSVNPVDAFAAIQPKTTINWPNPVGSAQSFNTAKLDDLLHASVNSRGNFFSAQDPEEFARALTESLADIANRASSGSALAASSTKLTSNTYVYQAKYDFSDWSGQFLAFPVDKATGVISSTAAWDSAAVMPAHASRNIYTWNGSAGAIFSWDTLTTAQKTSLTNTNVVNYLRGDQSKEVSNGGTYRNRSTILGDIVNSDPLYVGTDNFGHSLLAGSEGATYPAFLASKKNRVKMLYVGANDGMLHGFKATDGVEQFAYVPDAVVNNMALLASSNYSHRYFVDGSPVTGDAYLGGAWKSILLGTTGAGGKAVFALDITAPASNPATNKVIWEFTHANNLGYTIGQPTVARLNNSRWAAIFGNGYESTEGKSKLFIVYLDANLSDGTWNLGTDYLMLDTDSTTSNGLSSPSLYDSNMDGIADYAYAGDLQGNLWKFDLSDASTTNWGVANKLAGVNKPMFTAINDDNQKQPITSLPEIGAPPSGKAGVMLQFGTGSYYASGDNTNKNTQSFYGIWDNFVANNQITATRATALQKQSILYEGVDPGNADRAVGANAADVRVTSNTTVDYATKRGWYMDLIGPSGTKQGERVVSRPVLHNNRVIFSTLIPNDDDPCDPGTSWLMELGATTGARPSTSLHDLNNDDKFDGKDLVTVTIAGVTTTVAISSKKSTVGILDTPTIITDSPTKDVFGLAGTQGSTEEKRKSADPTLTGRVSWHELLNE